jgi:hypothetical protein
MENTTFVAGEMAEWSNAAVLKTVVRATEPGVRIPLSPQKQIQLPRRGHFYFEAVASLLADSRKIKMQTGEACN